MEKSQSLKEKAPASPSKLYEEFKLKVYKRLSGDLETPKKALKMRKKIVHNQEVTETAKNIRENKLSFSMLKVN